jgi:hypothetical protein
MKDKTTDAARDRDADRQLAKAKSSVFPTGKSSGGRSSTKPENTGLSAREIKALEAENHGVRSSRRGVVSERARRARRGRR